MAANPTKVIATQQRIMSSYVDTWVMHCWYSRSMIDTYQQNYDIGAAMFTCYWSFTPWGCRESNAATFLTTVHGFRLSFRFQVRRSSCNLLQSSMLPLPWYSFNVSHFLGKPTTLIASSWYPVTSDRRHAQMRKGRIYTSIIVLVTRRMRKQDSFVHEKYIGERNVNQKGTYYEMKFLTVVIYSK